MSQVASDIISRSAWSVDDELHDTIKPQELVNSLDRVYREYCRRTKLLTGQIGFLTTSGLLEYDLFGPITGSSDVFGDEILGFYRVEYNSKPTAEKSTEEILNARMVGLNTRQDSTIFFAFKYVGTYLRMFFPFATGDADEVDLSWYKLPRIGTISTLNSAFEIQDMYVDDLIIGLDVYAWRTLGIRQAKKEQTLTMRVAQGERIPYYFSLSKFAFEQMKDAEAKWEKRLLERSREVNLFHVDTTPIVTQIATPFTTELDDSFQDEIDYTNQNQ